MCGSMVPSGFGRLVYVEELFSARVPKASAELHRCVIHVIEESEGVGQQEEKSDKRDDEEGDEVKGDFVEIRGNAHSAHETWRWQWDEWTLKLEPKCACI